MTIEQLAQTEKELHLIVLELDNKERSDESDEKLRNIFELYKDIHKQYSDLADKQDEALKRGLFIQWYCITEPPYLTGIGDLDDSAEIKIIKVLNDKIEKNNLDDELKWMLNYYLSPSWVFVFDRFKGYKGLDKAIKNHIEYNLPERIDRVSMETRGIMGKYWNSLTRFK